MIAQAVASLLCAIMVADGGATGVQAVIKPREPESVIEAVEVLEEEPEEPAMHLYGNCRITFYCHCAACNGRAGANCASGVQPTVNHTVATGSLPFGTRLLIDGQEYVVEDRGVGDFEIDIFVASHEVALQRGLYYTDVYIID